MSKFYLAVWEDNWADEIDVQGFLPLYEEEKISLEKNIEKFQNLLEEDEFDYDEYYVGTNEGIPYTSLGMPSIKEITEEEYDVLIRLFGWQFGKFPNFGDIVSGYED